MSKIIIHNKTDMSDEEALKFVKICYQRPQEFKYFEFMGGTKVQVVENKTCKTFYVYS